jgi:hypothetical protein
MKLKNLCCKKCRKSSGACEITVEENEEELIEKR